ncbi:MAG TPA: pseudouridine synthase [Gaiellaceae bacterium]|nr:pseudouridine synthase [Gaiellaceae bacterium]
MNFPVEHLTWLNACVRLNAFLARAGVASRRRADELILDRRVRVNGEPGELNTVVGDSDVVEVDGRRVEKQPLHYVLLNKPTGVITTVDDPHGRPTVVDLVSHPTRIVPVGRLDADTTGALLLTNDGDLANRLAHPSFGVAKVYDVELDGSPSPEALETLRRGIDLEDGRTAPAEARIVRRGTRVTRIELTLHEGRRHQVKRMCAAVGHSVRHLHRRRYAGLRLVGLEPGQWRELTRDEVAELRRSVGL